MTVINTLQKTPPRNADEAKGSAAYTALTDLRTQNTHSLQGYANDLTQQVGASWKARVTLGAAIGAATGVAGQVGYNKLSNVYTDALNYVKGVTHWSKFVANGVTDNDDL